MRCILLALPLLVAACTIPEPQDREGTWRATGVNDANLRAMVVEPGHLDRGVQPVTAGRGAPAARAIRRAESDNPQRLPPQSGGGASLGSGIPAPGGTNAGR